MRALWRAFLLAATVILVSAAVVGCGGADDQAGNGGPTSTTAQTQATAADSGQDEPQAETEVIGMPDGFPSDVPVHPGTVTAYDPMQVTETITVHQLTVESVASFEDVIAWV